MLKLKIRVKFYKIAILAIMLGLSSWLAPSYADNASKIKIIGEKSVTLNLGANNITQARSAAKRSAAQLNIKVLELELTPQAKIELIQNADEIQADRELLGSQNPTPAASAGIVDLGMNGVPVLNQGRYGTCTTFAATAAIDAHMASGDYISQQCLLELTSYLDPIHSGWDGAWGANVFAAMVNNGVVAKSVCPRSYGDTSAVLTIDDYQALSNKLWANDFKVRTLDPHNLDQIKYALDNGHRVLISTMLHAKDIVGAPIKGAPNGLWSLPQDVAAYMQELTNGQATGHSIIVIGYDDNTQMLKIRNSWSAYAGVGGDYYMTYEFYQLMNMDAIEVY